MDNKELIKVCRYYKGERKSPFKAPEIVALWNYERAWAIESAEISTRGKAPEAWNVMLDDFLRVGLRTFQNDDGIPVTLKALLLNRFAKGYQSLEEAVEPFKEFYKKYYYKRASK